MDELPKYNPRGMGEIASLDAPTFEEIKALSPTDTLPVRKYLRGIAEKFLRREDILFKDAEFVISESDFSTMFVFAHYDVPLVCVQKEYLIRAPNEDEIAYGIAHELAHKQINLLKKSSVQGRYAENYADQLAVTWLIEAGYNWKAARDYSAKYASSNRYVLGSTVHSFVRADHSESQTRAKYIETYIGAWINLKGFRVPPEPSYTPTPAFLRTLWNFNFRTYIEHVLEVTNYGSQSQEEQLNILLSIPLAELEGSQRRRDFLAQLNDCGEQGLVEGRGNRFVGWYRKLPASEKKGDYYERGDFGVFAYAAVEGRYGQILERDNYRRQWGNINELAFAGPDRGSALSPDVAYFTMEERIQGFLHSSDLEEAVETARALNRHANSIRRDKVIQINAIEFTAFKQGADPDELPWAKFYDWVTLDESGEIAAALWHMGASGDEELWKKVPAPHLAKVKDLPLISIPCVRNYAPAEKSHISNVGMRSRFDRHQIGMESDRERSWQGYTIKARIQLRRLEEFIAGQIELDTGFNQATLTKSPKAYASLLEWNLTELNLTERSSYIYDEALNKIRQKLGTDLKAVAAIGEVNISEILQTIYIDGTKNDENGRRGSLDGLFFPHRFRYERGFLSRYEFEDDGNVFSDPLIGFFIKHGHHLDAKSRGRFLGKIPHGMLYLKDGKMVTASHVRTWLEYEKPENISKLNGILKKLYKEQDYVGIQKFVVIELQDWVVRRNLAADHPDVANLAPAIESSAKNARMYEVVDYLAKGIDVWETEQSGLDKLDSTSAISLFRLYDSFDLLKNRKFKNALISKIDSDIREEPDPERKRHLCENVLLNLAWYRDSDSGSAIRKEAWHNAFSSVLKNPELIECATREWAVSIRQIHGMDDGTKEYTQRLSETINEFGRRCTPGVACTAIRHVCDEVVAQRATAFMCRDYLNRYLEVKSDQDVKNMHYGVVLGEALVGFFSATDEKCRLFIDYLSKPITHISRNQVASLVWKEYSEYRERIFNSPDSRSKDDKFFQELEIDLLSEPLQRLRLNSLFEYTHYLFWEQNLSFRAVIMDQLLLPARNVTRRSDDLNYDHPDNSYRKATEFVLDRLFPLLPEPVTISQRERPSARFSDFPMERVIKPRGMPRVTTFFADAARQLLQRSSENKAPSAQAAPSISKEERKKRKFIRTFLHRYIANSHQTERGLLLSAFMTASVNQGEQSEAQRFALILETLGPAYTKLSQAVYQHPKTPEDYRNAMQHMNKKSNVPARWDHYDRIDEVLPASIIGRIAWCGPVTGAASFKVVSNIRFDNGDEETLGYLRKNAYPQAIFGYEKMSKTARDVVRDMPELADVGIAIVEMIEQTKELTANETDLKIGAQQTMIGQKVFDPMVISTDGYEFHFQFMPWKYHTGEAMIMQTGKGVHWDELPVSSEVEGKFHRASAKAFLTLIWTPILAGIESDMDRHIGQALMGTGSPQDRVHNVPLFDAGGIALVPPSEGEIRQLGQCLAQVLSKGKLDLQTMPDEFLAIVTDIQRTSSIRPDYLLRVQRAFMAGGSFSRAISQDDFLDVMTGIFRAGMVHPILASELRSALFGLSMQSGVLQKFLASGPDSLTVSRKDAATPMAPLYMAANDNFPLSPAIIVAPVVQEKKPKRRSRSKSVLKDKKPACG